MFIINRHISIISLLVPLFLSFSLFSCDDDDNNDDISSDEVDDVSDDIDERAAALARLLLNTTDSVVSGDAFYVTSSSAFIPAKLNIPSDHVRYSDYGVVLSDDPTQELLEGKGCIQYTRSSNGMDDASNEVFIAPVTDLSPSTIYRYRAFYSYGIEYFYGEEKSFTTLPPTVFSAQAVDLGLSVKWASANLGAEKPSQAGVYYAFGDTTGTLRPTKVSQCATASIYGTQLDAALHNLGDEWMMPTQAQILELLNNTTITEESLNGYGGYRLTSAKNSKSIFIPKAGYISAIISDDVREFDEQAYFWSGEFAGSSMANMCHIYSQSGIHTLSSKADVYWCLPIRPVCK